MTLLLFFASPPKLHGKSSYVLTEVYCASVDDFIKRSILLISWIWVNPVRILSEVCLNFYDFGMRTQSTLRAFDGLNPLTLVCYFYGSFLIILRRLYCLTYKQRCTSTADGHYLSCIARDCITSQELKCFHD